MQRQIPIKPIDQVIDSLNSYHTIIDVRSPLEFLEDHIPGAINLPVLSDAERAEIGTLYKQVDPFTAKKRGAALISINISNHLHTLSDQPKDWEPLVYCWRGGQRSRALALVMNEIGWSVTLIQGGYKAYRKSVQTTLNCQVDHYSFHILAGPTGCGKTRILNQLADDGHQVIDLEGLANHRGSILGKNPDTPQPSQKFFESELLNALRELDPNRPIWVESESAKIGDLHIPNGLFKQLMASPALSLTCDRDGRATFLMNDYLHLIDRPEETAELIQKLGFRQNSAQVRQWLDMIESGQWQTLSESLLLTHYDSAYAHSQKRFIVAGTYHLDQPGVLPPDLLKNFFVKTKTPE
jgi:tRNA 2-selenouridine synthase